MKIAILLLAAWLPSIAFSQEKTPLRRVGTNIFDFTPLIQSFRRGEITNSSFLVVGEVYQASEGSAYVVRKEFNRRLSTEFQREILMAGPAEQLKYLYVSQVIQRRDPLAAGEFLTWDPEMRQIYYDEIKREQDDYTYVRVYVTNCPDVHPYIGKGVRIFALPAGTYTFTDAANNSHSIPLYDYGHPYFGDTSNLTVFLVTSTGFVRKETPQETAVKKAAINAKLIAWQFQQASNGAAYVQYDLAKRYLNGDGVTKDEALGHHWLKRSADQNYEPAVKLLETIER